MDRYVGRVVYPDWYVESIDMWIHPDLYVDSVLRGLTYKIPDRYVVSFAVFLTVASSHLQYS